MPLILVVEDDDALQRLVQTVLVRAGYTVLCASDGQLGLERALEARPDLIITDVMMPRMDGWSLMRELRAHERTKEIPVIVLTQLDGREDRVQGFHLGADDYLPKPFYPEELVFRVRKVLVGGYLWDETRDLLTRETDFEGKLQRIGLSALLMMMESERKTGVLTLQHGGRRCRLALREGAVVRAQADDPTLEGQEVLYDALGWRSGTFSFKETEIAADDEIETPTLNLILEGARRLDEG